MISRYSLFLKGDGPPIVVHALIRIDKNDFIGMLPGGAWNRWLAVKSA